MSGLIVQVQLSSQQIRFYESALAYCYENDCQIDQQVDASESLEESNTTTVDETDIDSIE